MALPKDECQKCRLELDKLKSEYGRAGAVPEVAKARLGELEAALERECRSDVASSDSAGAAVVVVGLGVLGLGLLAAFLGGRR